MLPLLAQVPPEVIGWLSAAAWLVVFVGGCLGIWVAIKSIRAKEVETPQPLIVQGHVRTATWDELEAVKKEAHGRMNREKKEAQDALEAFVKRFDGELSTLSETVGSYNTNAEGRTDRINDRIDKLRDDIAAMPQEILQLIRNAQQI